MNVVHTLIATLLLFISVPVFAQSPGYTILGKGFQNKTTGEWLGLACVSNEERAAELKGDPTLGECAFIQHLYLKDEHATPELIGPMFKVTRWKAKWSDRKALKHQVKRLKQDYHNDENSRKLEGRREFFNILMAANGLASIPVFLAVNPWLGSFLVVSIIPLSMKRDGMFDSGYHVFEEFHNQADWNWSENSRLVKEKKFRPYIEWVKSFSRPVIY